MCEPGSTERTGREFRARDNVVVSARSAPDHCIVTTNVYELGAIINIAAGLIPVHIVTAYHVP